MFNHYKQERNNFNWKNVQILDNEQNYSKRLISEIVHIIKQNVV